MHLERSRNEEAVRDRVSRITADGEPLIPNREERNAIQDGDGEAVPGLRNAIAESGVERAREISRTSRADGNADEQS